MLVNKYKTVKMWKIILWHDMNKYLFFVFITFPSDIKLLLT